MSVMALFLSICLCVSAFAHPHTGGKTLSERDLSSENWSGAIVTVPDGGSFNAIISSITVPTVTGPIDAEYSAYAWIGIDGWGGLSNLFQAGLDVRGVDKGDGTYEPQFRGYYEWYPEGPQFSETSDLSLSSGDTLLVRVDASSSTSGVVYLENQRTGQSRKYPFNEPSYPLIGRYAEWIVEEFKGNELPSPCVFEFGTTEATTEDGQGFDASSASLVQVQDGRLVASFDGMSVKVESWS